MEAVVLPFFRQFDVAVQSASDATKVSAFSVLGLTCVAVEAASICCCAVCK